MKIDRLLSIIMYLMNRDLVSARELSERFNCSVRTIQRDMEAIELAGIPVVTIQGPNGGYGIMDTYRVDRKLVTVDELYFIIAALAGMESSLADPRIAGTLEKMRSLVPGGTAENLQESRGKFSLDFSMMGGGPRLKPILGLLEKALSADRLVRFTYTSTKMETSDRIVEPMTLVFKWRSWYLFAFCRQKDDYRLFRVERIVNPELLAGRFTRRNKTVEEFFAEQGPRLWGKTVRVKLRFDQCMRPFILPFNPEDTLETDESGFLVLTTSLPGDGSLFGYVLSFGKFAEVLEPANIRELMHGAALEIASLYEKNEKKLET